MVALDQENNKRAICFTCAHFLNKNAAQIPQLKQQAEALFQVPHVQVLSVPFVLFGTAACLSEGNLNPHNCRGTTVLFPSRNTGFL